MPPFHLSYAIFPISEPFDQSSLGLLVSGDDPPVVWATRLLIVVAAADVCMCADGIVRVSPPYILMTVTNHATQNRPQPTTLHKTSYKSGKFGRGLGATI